MNVPGSKRPLDEVKPKEWQGVYTRQPHESARKATPSAADKVRGMKKSRLCQTAFVCFLPTVLAPSPPP